ncbi:MAG: hypothetical protein WCI47_01670 [bacterium]
MTEPTPPLNSSGQTHDVPEVDMHSDATKLDVEAILNPENTPSRHVDTVNLLHDFDEGDKEGLKKVSKSKMTMAVLGVLAVLLIGGFTTFKIITSPKKIVQVTPSVSVTQTPTPLATPTGRTVTSDGKKLDPNTGKLGATVYDNNPNIGYKDTGGDDSIQEYEDLLAIRKLGDDYINALGSANNQVAWDMISSDVKQKQTQQSRYADWYGEYRNIPFSTSKIDSGTKMSWGSDLCLKSYSEGWAKTSMNAYYYTPSFNLTKEITTTIQLALVRETNGWKVRGENNLLINQAGINKNDPYSLAQSARTFTDPKKCN